MANILKASFDQDSVEGKMRIFNAQNGASKSMKDLENGYEIAVSDVLIYQDKVDSYGQEQESTITVLFTEDGTAYASISETVASASDGLVDFIETTGIRPVNVRLVKQTSGKGNEFLNLQMVM